MAHRIIFVFVDGIGLGAPGSSNPFSTISLPGFETLSDNQPWDSDAKPVAGKDFSFRGIDATLGIEGLPQSGTGQATLFTGYNCASIAGRHFGPFPHSATRETIRRYNVFTRVNEGTGTSAFSNAYPPVFFEHVRKRDRWTVTTRACLDSGTDIRTLDHLDLSRAVAADITGERLISNLNLPVKVITEREAARNLVSIASDHAFTLFEYFHSDKAGHARSPEKARQCLESLDQFIQGILHHIEGTDMTLILTSDHGNLEDLSVRTHTRNPVPFAAYGPGADAFHIITSITDVTPQIVSLLEAGNAPSSSPR